VHKMLLILIAGVIAAAQTLNLNPPSIATIYGPSPQVSFGTVFAMSHQTIFAILGNGSLMIYNISVLASPVLIQTFTDNVCMNNWIDATDGIVICALPNNAVGINVFSRDTTGKYLLRASLVDPSYAGGGGSVASVAIDHQSMVRLDTYALFSVFQGNHVRLVEIFANGSAALGSVLDIPPITTSSSSVWFGTAYDSYYGYSPPSFGALAISFPLLAVSDYDLKICFSY